MGNKASKKSSSTSSLSSSRKDKGHETSSSKVKAPVVPKPKSSKSHSKNSPSPRVTDVSKGSKKKGSEVKNDFSKKKAEELFNKYADVENASSIGPAGVQRLLDDLEVDPVDKEVLVFAFVLDAKQQGFFQKSEWMSGLQKLGCDSLPKLKDKFAQLGKELDDDETFKDIYRFAFNFCLETEQQRSIGLDIAVAMMGLLIPDGKYPLAKDYRRFLEDQTTFKALNKDQWLQTLEFLKTVDDVGSYDLEASAWPQLLDDFVEWKQNQPLETPPSSRRQEEEGEKEQESIREKDEKGEKEEIDE